MADVLSLAEEDATGTGTGNLTLQGTPANSLREFEDAAGTGTGNKFWYHARNVSTDGEWEHGIGYENGSGELVRDTIEDSSNAGNKVNFSSGTKRITSDYPGTRISGQYETEETFAAGGETITIDHDLPTDTPIIRMYNSGDLPELNTENFPIKNAQVGSFDVEAADITLRIVVQG